MVGGIGSLLAQIEGDKGDKPSTGSARPAPRLNPLAKRKADDQLRREPTKSARTGSVPRPGDKAISSPITSTRPLPRPGPAEQSTARTPSKPDPASRYNGATGAIRKPTTAPAMPSAAPAKPSASTAPAAPQKPPKKGSFAEILARGQRAQATMGQVGKIQHKRSEKPQLKKDRGDDPEPRSAAAVPRKPGAPPLARPAAKGAARAAPVDTKAGRKANPRTPDPEPEKKKVRQPPATGYAGTARPRPGAPSSSSRAAKPAPGGVLLNPQLQHRSKRDRDEDEDSLDGFVIDDDDGDEYGAQHRGGYYSGYESSDMEAGLGEIDEEEEHAAYIARRDDRREEQLERQRKLEKERRKREAMRR